MNISKFLSKNDILLVKKSGFFDENWYLNRYKDVKIIGIDPVEHFLWIGHRMGRSPSPKFSVPRYKNAHKDVKAAGVNPLLHYLKSGINENRTIYPVREGVVHEERQRCHRSISPRNKEWDWSIHNETIQRLESLPNPYVGDKISIIMPTYNRANVIDAAIRSAISQSHKNFELIIVDDGSTDETQEVVNKFKDQRITYTYNKRTKGVSGARNTGLDIASGDWVFFLDSDNKWRDKFIEFMLKHANDSKSSSGYCAANVCDDSNETKSILFADFDYESCLRANFIDLNCFFIRWSGKFRELRFDETLARLVDWDLILRVAAVTRITGIPYVGVDYYDGSSSRITNNTYTDKGEIALIKNRIVDKSKVFIENSESIADSSLYRIAVMFHVYHADVIPVCMEYLKNINFEFDIFVSTSLNKDDKSLDILRKTYRNVRIFNYPNVGSDIAPFLELMSTFKNYELVLKIHTKRDVAPWGDAWRRGLINPILGSETLIDDLIDHFRTNEKLVMACSAEFYKHGNKNSIQETYDRVHQLSKDFSVSKYIDKDWAFVAGSMFWIRPRVLLSMARSMCESEGYSVSFQRDGAIEHGLERLLGLILWQDESNQIAVVSMDGVIKEVGLGEGFTTDGVSHTMKRIHNS